MDSKTIIREDKLKVFKAMREEFVNQTFLKLKASYEEGEVYHGLCNVPSLLVKDDVITVREYNFIYKYLKKYLRSRKYLYRYDGDARISVKTKVYSGANLIYFYAWPIDIKPPRTAWLDAQIKKHS